MNPGLKYSLGRVGLFVVVAVPLLLVLPRDMNMLLKLMIALVISMALSFVVLRKWRDEMAGQMVAHAERRRLDKERLRAALAGDEETAETAESAQSAEKAEEKA
jgi:uncharacterized membrane protein YccC